MVIEHKAQFIAEKALDRHKRFQLLDIVERALFYNSRQA